MHLFSGLAASGLLATGLPFAPSIPQPRTGDLAAGLEAITEENILADVSYLASDELEGRDTPSPGLEKAAHYIREILKEEGLEPGAGEGYFYEYPLVQKRMDERSSLTLEVGGEPRALEYGAQYFLSSAKDFSNHEVGAGLVFCDRGLAGDFEGAEDRWALCLDDGGSAVKRRNTALKAGVAGLLVYPGSDYEGEPYAIRFASDVERSRRGVVRWPGEQRGRAASVPQLFLAGDVGLELRTALDIDRPVRVTEKRACEREIQVKNVCGLWRGSDPDLAEEVLIISAHYDHVGRRGESIFNGADDNASGSTGLIQLARALVAHGPMRRSVLLIWLSGEEKGLWGSKAWAQNPWLPEGYRAVAAVNIDMIGRNAPNELLITPTRKLGKEYNGLTRLAEALCELEGFDRLGSADEYWYRSDHYNFARMGIPVAFLFADVHEDYHRETDTVEKLDLGKIRRATRLVLRMLAGLQAQELEL